MTQKEWEQKLKDRRKDRESDPNKVKLKEKPELDDSGES
jgi:hypothetical protein